MSVTMTHIPTDEKSPSKEWDNESCLVDRRGDVFGNDGNYVDNSYGRRSPITSYDNSGACVVRSDGNVSYGVVNDSYGRR